MIPPRIVLSVFLLALSLAPSCDREKPRTAEQPSPSPESLSPSADFRLAPGRAGALRLGMHADSVLAVYGPGIVREVDLQLEGMPTPALEIRLPEGPADRPSLTAEFNPQTRMVYRIRVRDPRFRTGEGIGPGSTLNDLRARHSVRDIVHGEGNTVAVVPGLGMSFLLDPDAVPESFLLSGNALDIPDSIAIVGVFVIR